MKTLLRLCSAAALLVAVTACADTPTAPEVATASGPRHGVLMGGGHRSADSDTTTVNTVSGDQNTFSTGCLEERGGVIIGGGHLVDDPACPTN